jgi:hypothetical protein
MAKRVSGSATVVVEANTRKCVVRANSSPPPNAGPASAAIVGIGSLDIEVNVPRRFLRNSAVLSSVHQSNGAKWPRIVRRTLLA